MTIKKHSFIKHLISLWGRRMRLQSEQEQLKYLSQSVKLEETVNPHIIRLTVVMVCVAILVFIVWSSVAKINEIAKAIGEVVPKGFTQVVQHLDGGIVTELSVAEGDIVEKGQVLVIVDDGGATEDLAEVQSKQLSLSMQSERLRAYVENREPDFDQFQKQSSDDIEKLIHQNKRSYASMVGSYQKEENVVKEQIKQKESEIDVQDSQRESINKRLTLANEALQLQKTLHDKGLTSKLKLITYQKEASELEGQLQEIKNKINKAYNAISEYKNRLTSLEARRKNEAYKLLDEVEREIGQNREVLEKKNKRVQRLQVKSPVRGIVKGLKINTIGGVIRPGDVLMEIVPLDQNLVVEVRISPKDRGHVKVGQKVLVKVSSYDFARYGGVDGKLDFISATTFIDDKGRTYYRGRVELLQNYIGNDPTQNVIIPGMTVEADINTGKKTILNYLLKPIHLSLKSAMTER